MFFILYCKNHFTCAEQSSCMSVLNKQPRCHCDVTCQAQIQWYNAMQWWWVTNQTAPMSIWGCEQYLEIRAIAIAVFPNHASDARYLLDRQMDNLLTSNDFAEYHSPGCSLRGDITWMGGPGGLELKLLEIGFGNRLEMVEQPPDQDGDLWQRIACSWQEDGGACPRGGGCDQVGEGGPPWGGEVIFCQSFHDPLSKKNPVKVKLEY